MENISIHETHNTSKAQHLTYHLLTVFVFLVPLFFLTPSFMSFQMSKILLMVVLVLIPIISLILFLLRKKEFPLTKNPVIIAGFIVPLVLFVSSIFGGNTASSLIGKGFETGTTSFVFLMFCLMVLAYSTLRKRDNIMRVYAAFFGALTLVLLYQFVRLFTEPSFLSFSLFNAPVSNFIGKWNDLGIFFGAGAMMSLITLEFLPLSTFSKIFVACTGILSLIYVALVNFTVIWYVLGILALCIGIYAFFSKRKETHEDQPRHRSGSFAWAALIVVLVSLIFIVDSRINTTPESSSLMSPVVDHFKLSQLEVRPSWAATFGIARDMFKAKPATTFLGAGPNRFTSQYVMYKPAEVNNSIFWNYDFDFGIGYIPTFLVTAGALGLLSWLVFLIFFGYKGIQALRTSSQHTLPRYLLVSSFFIALYLWMVTIVYTTGSVIIALAFFFTGLALAVFEMERKTHQSYLVHFGRERYSIRGASYSLLGVLLIGGVILLCLYLKIGIASMYFQNGIYSLNTTGNIEEAEKSLLKAVDWYENDNYYQGLAELNLLKMSKLLSSGNSSTPENVALLQTYLTSAITYSSKAVTYDPTNYQNWTEAGRVFEAVVPLQVKDAYVGAGNSYVQAINDNPTNPALYLMLARLEVANKNIEDAKKYLATALQLKSNYAEAAFLLSQIQVQEGNIPDAIKSVQAAAQFSPNDQTIYFQLGLLEYNAKNYAAAIEALQRAVALDPQYSNARYFLGLSLYNVGRVDEALAEFQTVLQYNPSSQEVMLIINNLKAGKQPFANAKAPVDSKPEKRQTLPVKDDTKTKATNQTI